MNIKNLFKTKFNLPIKYKKIDPLVNRVINENYQSIAKVDRGNSFKGHSFNIHFRCGLEHDKGLIHVTNAYYSGYVHQEYNIDEHKTTTTYSTHGTVPKWLKEKIVTIGETLQPNIASPSGGSYNTWFFNVDENPALNIYTTEYVLKYNVVAEGVKFNSHFDNINELKELTQHYRKIREKLKYSDINEIMQHTKGHLDLYMLSISKNFIL
tara:strand:+ start:489 stop:1118 length:630 start_codon:yes stop_codon:yes gene_type:complete